MRVTGRRRRGTDSNRYSQRVELTNQLIYRKIDDVVRTRKLYEDASLRMGDVVDVLGTNRTYVSRALMTYDGGFNNFIKRVRVEKISAYLEMVRETGECLMDGEDMAITYGFTNRRAMDRALKQFLGKTFYDIRKEITERDIPVR